MKDLAQLAAARLDRESVPPGQSVAVACSGGPDSTALAHVAAALSRAGRVGQVVLVHVDHGLRPGSDADGAAVQALATRLGVGCALAEVTVARDRASLEDAARDARYAALAAIAAERSLAWIWTGHTASDQAETVLMRIVRGTGVLGLAGIPPRRDAVVRPLIDATRADVLAWIEAHSLPVLADPMNEDAALTRNRARSRWLPALREENPRIDLALVRLAASAREQVDVLTAAAEGLDMSAAALAAVPAAVAKFALARAAADAGAGELSATHLDDLLALARREDAGTIELALPGLTAQRVYDEIRFVPTEAAEPWQMPAMTVDGPDAPYATRRWRPGDRMRPQRLRGRSRKLSDLFVDAKIPREQRSSAVVVVRERDGAIVWAEHIGPAFETVISVTLTQ